MKTRINQAGFTITELAISVIIAGIMASTIFIATFYYFANMQQAQATTELALESQSILAQLTEDIRLADNIATTNALTDAHAPAGGWVTSNPSNIIIVKSPAIDSSRTIIYDDSTGFPYKNELIYFVSGSSMYKRVLANSSATGNVAKTTCPSAQSTPTCPPDRLFSASANNLSFTFYDADGATTANATNARSVYLQIDMSRKVFGKTIGLTNSTRVTLRNQ